MLFIKTLTLCTAKKQNLSFGIQMLPSNHEMPVIRICSEDPSNLKYFVNENEYFSSTCIYNNIVTLLERSLTKSFYRVILKDGDIPTETIVDSPSDLINTEYAEDLSKIYLRIEAEIV